MRHIDTYCDMQSFSILRGYDMEEKKKMNLDEMKKAKMPLNDEELSMVSGAGGWALDGIR